jgi:class 3 adenylate cyclase/tetratricopeptide (TPR) repeat protein
MQCPQCQHGNPDGQKFCGECGVRLALSCPACHAANPPANKFCGECGAQLTAAAPAAGAAPALSSPAGPTDSLPEAPAPQRFGSPERYTPRHLAEKILTSRSAVEGERKQVTVMFTDVSGFTAMSERLDAEEVHAIMDRAFEVILAAVHGYEGTINQFLGDGVMALFGAPIAHEDHAGRALRVALAIQDRLEPLRADVQRAHGRDFRMRIGINTGLVVVGAIGRDLRMDYTALGDTVNLAARLLNVAEPGQIVVSRRTKELGEGFFLFEDLGDFQVKGKTEPQRAYAVMREVGGRTPLEVSRERGLTPLIGRAAERQRLVEACQKACAGRGGVVVIAGDPGVGKSRLLSELLKSLDGDGCLELDTACASYGRAMAYRPLIDLYQRYLDLEERTPADEIERRISERLGVLGLEDREAALLLQHFLGVAVSPEFLLRVQGARLRDRTNEVLRSVIFREAARRPVVVIVENMQWVDESTQECLTRMAERVSDHRVLLALTTRPNTPLEWLPATAEILRLEGLDPDDLREMARALCGTRAVSEPLFQLLMAKGDGNPLYVEEIVKQLQETGGIVVDDGEARLRAADVTVPETIRDIVAARVDRLAESPKQTLQVASVLGRRFGVALASYVRETGRDHVVADLQDLQAVDFVFPSGHEAEPTYSFKHALTQDVVYTSLLERRRRRFHAAAGRGLEALYRGRLGEVVELLAYHFERSAEDDQAVDYAILAAEKAQRRWANAEALALFEAALTRLATMPDTEANRLRKIDAVVKQAEIKFALGRHVEHVHALEAIRDVIAIADPPRRATWAYWTGFLHSMTGAPPEVSIAYCREALAIAEASGLEEIRPFAECCLTHVYSVSGGLREGLVTGKRALAMFEARGNVWWSCRTLWGLMSVANGIGAWDESLAYCRRALAYGQDVNDLRLRIVGWWRTGSTHAQRGDLQAGLGCCEEALALSPNALDAAMTKAVRGYCRIKLGQLEPGIAELEEVLDWLERSHLGHYGWFYGYWLAEGYLRRGATARARGLVEEILATSRGASRRAEGIGERLLGESLMSADPAAAIQHLESASRILEEVGAQNEVARVLLALGEFHRITGDPRTARTLLEGALRRFEEIGTLDEPPRVRAALAALGATPTA